MLLLPASLGLCCQQNSFPYLPGQRPWQMKKAGPRYLLLICLVLSGCTEPRISSSTSTSQVPVRIRAAERLVRIGSSVPISVMPGVAAQEAVTYEWEADAGHIAGNGPEVTYTAPGQKGQALVRVRLKQGNRTVGQDSLTLQVYKQVIILKADDMMFRDSINLFFQEWDNYLDYIRAKKIPSSVGIIMSSLDQGTKAYAEKVRALQVRDGIELWNHGYTHQLNGTNEQGEKFHEFWNTSLAYQIGQLQKSQALAREKLGLTLRAFGAPGNQIDSNTVKALEAVPELQVWLYGKPGVTSKLVLENLPGDQVEYPVHNPDFQKFRENYDPTRPYLVLQYHPQSWDERRLGEFKKVIDFLEQEGVTFVTPLEYYEYVREDL